jgi:hypothetical protein
MYDKILSIKVTYFLECHRQKSNYWVLCVIICILVTRSTDKSMTETRFKIKIASDWWDSSRTNAPATSNCSECWQSARCQGALCRGARVRRRRCPYDATRSNPCDTPPAARRPWTCRGTHRATKQRSCQCPRYSTVAICECLKIRCCFWIYESIGWKCMNQRKHINTTFAFCMRYVLSWISQNKN